MSDDDTLAMLRALAKERGVSFEELLADLLRAKAEGRTKIERRQSTAMDIEDKADSRWTDAEVAERWMEEERNDPHGVLGPGGMTGGGIFGEGAIATEAYDPMAAQRGESRAIGAMNASVQVEMLRTMQEMRRELAESRAERKALPAPRRELPRRRR